MVSRTARSPLWLVDWSDSEDEDFRHAWRATNIETRVLRASPLGATVGTRRHRLRSWPAYAGLAARGLRRADGGVLVAWQPLAGALAGLLRRGPRPPLVLLNPLLDPRSQGFAQGIAVRGARRAERVVFFSRGGCEVARTLGFAHSRTMFVPLGVRARVAHPNDPGNYLLAAGRDGRDWDTLARAAGGLPLEVRVLGPTSLPGSAPLRLLPPVDRPRFLELLAGAAALIVPLVNPSRTAGQLAVLDAMSMGRAVVATRAQGTVDYVREDTGILVPPGDAGALRSALERVCEPGVAGPLGEAALAAARGPLSLERFVRDVDGVATSLLS
jgi:glycosyltransferase involved in cell wall biosynthesis